MRRAFGLMLVLTLALIACGGTPEPASPAAGTPGGMAAASPALTTGRLGQETSVAVPPSATPVPPPSAPAPSPTAPSAPTPSASSPWPAFLRELNFGIPVGNSYGPRALAVHPGLDRIYARTRSRDLEGSGWVTMLDRSSGQVLASAKTGLDSAGEGDLVVDGQQNRVYVVNPGDGTCSILDAASLNSIDSLDGVDRLALDEAAGWLYVAGLARLRVLDTAGYDVLKETPVSDAPEFLALAVEPVGGRVYLAYRDSAGTSLGQYDATTLRQLATTLLPGRPDAVVPDPNRMQVYVTLNDGERSLLWTLDEDGQIVEEREMGEWGQRTYLALDPAGDRLFLGRDAYPDSGIGVVDLTSGQEVANLLLDPAPNALYWDAAKEQLLVSHTYADKIRLVDGEITETLALWPTALDLVDLAMDPERSYLYVTDSAGQLHVLDSETDEALAILPGEGALAVDSPHGRLYTGGEGASRVRVFDADSLQQTGEIPTTAKPVADAYHGGLYLVQSGIYLASLETMTVTAAVSSTLPQAPGYSPNPAAVDAVVDPGSGRVFAIINNGVPGSNGGTYLYVYEAETYQQVLTDTERSPIYVDVNPVNGRAYVSRIHLAGRSTSLLEDGRRYTARLEAVYGALRVDPTLDRLYLTVYGDEEGYLLVLDADTLDLLGSVPIPGGFTLRALDPQRHQLYLASREGRVQIWSASGGTLAAPAEPVRARPAAEEIDRLFLGPGDMPLFTGSLYRSGDEGRSWQDIGQGLPQRGVQEAVVSPAFAQDATLFAVLAATDEGLGIWKSGDGGVSWWMANRGLSDMAVNDLAISPNYAADQTLFATTRRQGLFRSTDGGESWLDLSERYHAAEPYPALPGNVYLSPTYAQDQTLFVAHYGLQRSGDGGETWVGVLPDEASLALSPEFATDRTLFGWTASGGVLRSTDGGDTWQPASTGLALTGYGSGRVIVSPDYPSSATIYFIWTSSSLDAPPQFFRSRDSGMSWEGLLGPPPQGATPVELSADGTAFLALDAQARLARWPVGSLSWAAVPLTTVDELQIARLLPSPNFTQDRTLWAVGEDGSLLQSGDAGLTWSDAGFPLRTTNAMDLAVVIVPPQTLLVGTEFGLYRSQDGATWARVEGGLPQAMTRITPQLAVDGSLRALVSGEDEGDVLQVFLSTDGGQTWTEPIPPLPRAGIVEEVQFSPAFATDHTAFFAQNWGKAWRSSRGGAWQEIGPRGEWNLSALQLSPAFDRDGLIFLRLEDNSLWRSTDKGDSWSEIAGPWGAEAPQTVVPGMGYALDILTFSPAFGQDGVLLTRAGNTLYRSTDRGTTWAKVLDLAPPPVQVAFSPDYTRDGQIYLLQGRTLYQSTDRGRRWQAMPPAPWAEFDEVKLLLSPAFGQDHTLLGWTPAGRVYQSQDGGKSWRDVGDGLPQANIRQIVFSPAYADDGLLYLVPFGPGLYKRVGNRPWMASSEAGAPVTATAVPTSKPAPTPTPTARPAACVEEPTHFRAVWQQARVRLGCPEQQAEPLSLAEQAFEHGRMIWDSTDRQIYVLSESGKWQAFADTFVDGVDPAYDAGLPPPPQQPQRGFGKVWRTQLGGPQAAIGWALEGERPVSGWRQPFDHGLLVWTDATPAGAKSPGAAYLLYGDGTWQTIPSPGP